MHIKMMGLEEHSISAVCVHATARAGETLKKANPKLTNLIELSSPCVTIVQIAA